MSVTLVQDSSIVVTMSHGQTNWPFVINVSNSIIGVTVLAMPFCFKTCGIILGSLMLFFSTWLTERSCQLLMKAGITSRRRSYSMLAQYTHGATGKLIVELGMIGLQLGTLVAQVVIIGDLGPAIVSKFTGLPNTDRLRTGLIVFLCLFVGLPLGLLKDVRTLSKTSAMCILFYAFFTVYVVLLSIPNLITGSWWSKVVFWRKEGFFQCLPIFSFAFGCQTQLFIVYEALSEPSLKRIYSIISAAVHLCTAAYLLVGFFGYVAFCDVTDLSGDIINHFGENSVSDAIKLCFVFSIAVSIPLIVFPCRASLYTLLFPQKPKEDVPGAYKIPEFHFKVITAFIIVGSMIIGILVPNVEFVLGLNGATMGTLICYIFPALFFLAVMADTSEGKLSGRMVLAFGLTILIVSTYTTLNTPSPAETAAVEAAARAIGGVKSGEKLPTIDDTDVDVVKKDGSEEQKQGEVKEPPDKDDDERHEPPIPQPPDEVDKPDEHDRVEADKADYVKDKKETGKVPDANDVKVTKKATLKEKEMKEKVKEEILKEEEGKIRAEAEEKARLEVEEKLKEQDRKQEQILEKLEQQKDAQEQIIAEQKQILEELKQHQEQHKEEPVKVQEEQGNALPPQGANAQQAAANVNQFVAQQPVPNGQQVVAQQPVQGVVAQQPAVNIQQGAVQQPAANGQVVQQPAGNAQGVVAQPAMQQQQQQQPVGGQPLQQQQGLNQQVPLGQGQALPVQQAAPQQQVGVNGQAGQAAPVVNQQGVAQPGGQPQQAAAADKSLGAQQVNNQQVQQGQNQEAGQQVVKAEETGKKSQNIKASDGAYKKDSVVKPLVRNDDAVVGKQDGDDSLRRRRNIELDDEAEEGVDVEEKVVNDGDKNDVEGKGRDLKQIENTKFVNEFLEINLPEKDVALKDKPKELIDNDMDELNNKIDKDFDVRNGAMELDKDAERRL